MTDKTEWRAAHYPTGHTLEWSVFRDGTQGTLLATNLTKEEAHLIAAAPEMREALERADFYSETLTELMDQIRAALAKATPP